MVILLILFLLLVLIVLDDTVLIFITLDFQSVSLLYMMAISSCTILLCRSALNFRLNDFYKVYKHVCCFCLSFIIIYYSHQVDKKSCSEWLISMSWRERGPHPYLQLLTGCYFWLKSKCLIVNYFIKLCVKAHEFSIEYNSMNWVGFKSLW